MRAALSHAPLLECRNRHDQTAGRAQKKPGSGRGDANSLARYVGAAGARRGVDQVSTQGEMNIIVERTVVS